MVFPVKLTDFEAMAGQMFVVKRDGRSQEKPFRVTGDELNVQRMDVPFCHVL